MNRLLLVLTLEKKKRKRAAVWRQIAMTVHSGALMKGDSTKWPNSLVVF